MSKNMELIGTMTDTELNEQVRIAREKLTGYSPEEKAVIELINHLIDRYGISLYSLEVYFEQHECERPD